MHFEILVEDISGKKALETIVPKIIDSDHTFRIIPYKGIGRIPKDLAHKADPQKRMLLSNLLKLLRGYGNTHAGYNAEYKACVFVICDLDDNCRSRFRQDILSILQNCMSRPDMQLCIAIEEGEAWLLGDIPAIKSAYSKAKDSVLNGYTNDSICGTWELLADAIYSGGASTLRQLGWQRVGAEKSKWAEAIATQMDIDNNNSNSFCYFRDKLLEFASK